MSYLILTGMHIYLATCIYFIASKMNSENAWLAWIPFFNLYLMSEMTKIRYFWLLPFFALSLFLFSIYAPGSGVIYGPNFLPGILAIFFFGVFVYIWVFKITLLLNKPISLAATFAVSCVFPLTIALGWPIVFGYLAFSKAK